MNGYKSIGYMLQEEGRIVSVRNEEHGVCVEFDGVVRAQVLGVPRMVLEADGWELGWKCPKCMGDGIISVRCRCVDRPRHVQAADPCCGGWDEAECPECEGGIQWREEY